MLETVGDKLIDDDPAGDGLVDPEGEWRNTQVQRNALGCHIVGPKQVIGEVTDVRVKLDPGKVTGPVELLVNHGHGPDAPLTFLQSFEGWDIADVFGLQAEKARNDLEIVLHAMVNLLQESFLLLQRGRDPSFRFNPPGDINGDSLSGHHRALFVPHKTRPVLKPGHRTAAGHPAQHDGYPLGFAGVQQAMKRRAILRQDELFQGTPA